MAWARYHLLRMDEFCAAEDAPVPDPGQVFEPVPKALFQPMGDEAVLLSLDSDHYFGLDDVGTRMYLLLTERLPFGEVVRRLLAEYEVGEPVLRRDLTAMVVKLERAGLISRVRT